MKMNPFFLLVVSLLIVCFPVHSQVPISEFDEPVPAMQPRLPFTSQQLDVPFGPLSDPAELSLIEGLDEPMERLRLRDQDTNMILDLIQVITGRYILRPQNLPAVKITFDSRDVLTKRETLLAVESLLAMNGIGISKIDDKFFKAVPATGMNVHVPIWLDGPAGSLKPSQRIYVKMFHLEYAPAIEVREQLNAFSTPNVGSLILFEKANSILVTDSLLNLQRMEKIIETVDRSITPEEVGTIFHVQQLFNAAAKNIKAKLDAMIEKSLKPFLGGTTVVETDERTNSIFIITRKQNMEMIKFFIDEMDAENEIPFTTSKLFKLQHADAKEIHRILVEVVTKTVEVTKKLSGEDRSAAQTERQANTATTKEGIDLKKDTTSKEGEQDGVDFSEQITISVSERSNSILVYGTKKDIADIEKIIEQLDEPLPLARIDTIFVMVDLNQQRQRGIDALFKGVEWSDGGGIRSETFVNPGVDGQLGTTDDYNDVRTVENREGLDAILQVPILNSAIPFRLENWKLSQIQWDQIFSIASERTDVRIFSTPSIMVSHNADSVHIKIEDERNIVIPTYYGNMNTTTNSNTGQRDQITASTELEIKSPKIGLPGLDADGNLKRGSIFMEVTVKAEKFDESQSNTYQGQNLPGRKVREAMSLVSVMDGEIIVLGGLQEVQLNTSEQRYNLLSDLPFFGKKFFRPKNVKYTPTELMIFLKPTIIDPNESTAEENSEILDRMLDPSYTPVFRAPSGRILGVPDLDGKSRNNTTMKDAPSIQPKL